MAKVNPNNMLAAGTLLEGRYRIEKYLSSGGCGNTYLARDTKFSDNKSRVVVKEFFLNGITHRELQTSRVIVSNTDNAALFEKLRRKFRDEADRIYALRHPNIVRVSDVFDTNHTSYYVMDYIAGGSMSEKAGRITERQAVKYIREVLGALNVVHREGLYHLDIKPANIMLNQWDNAILIDFGASKMLGAGEGNTLSSTMLYTKGYAPTEQMYSDMASIGAWTDFYAIGATLFNLLTSQQPPLPHILTTRHGAEAIQVRGADKGVQDFITACMQPDFSERPQNVAQMLSLLDAANPQDKLLVTIIPVAKEVEETPDKPVVSVPEDSEETERVSKPTNNNNDKTERVSGPTNNDNDKTERVSEPTDKKEVSDTKAKEEAEKNSRTKIYVLAAILVGLCSAIGIFTFLHRGDTTSEYVLADDSTSIDSAEVVPIAEETAVDSTSAEEPAPATTPTATTASAPQNINRSNTPQNNRPTNNTPQTVTQNRPNTPSRPQTQTPSSSTASQQLQQVSAPSSSVVTSSSSSSSSLGSSRSQGTTLGSSSQTSTSSSSSSSGSSHPRTLGNSSSSTNSSSSSSSGTRRHAATLGNAR